MREIFNIQVYSKQHFCRLVVLVCSSMLLLTFVSCRISNQVESIYVSDEDAIFEYAISPENSKLAIIVPAGKYRPEEGYSKTRIQIVDWETKEIVAQLPKDMSTSFDYPPTRLEWLGEEMVLFQQDGSVWMWNFVENRRSLFSMPYGNYSVSKHSLSIAWWSPLKIGASKIQIYEYGNAVQEKSTFFLEGDAGEIVDVEWGPNDTNLLIVSRSETSERGKIYTVNLLSGEISKVTEIDNVLLHTNEEIVWNADEEWVGIVSTNDVKLYSLTKECFFRSFEGIWDEPTWSGQMLFARDQLKPQIVSFTLGNQIKCIE